MMTTKYENETWKEDANYDVKIITMTTKIWEFGEGEVNLIQNLVTPKN